MTGTLPVCPLQDLAPGTMRLVQWHGLEILVANCEGTVRAIENRCSHDDGPLNEGVLDQHRCTIECPRHGSIFDLRSGRPLRLPAYQPVDTFPIQIVDGEIRLDLN